MHKLFALTVVLLAPFAVLASDGANQQARTLFAADWHTRLQSQPEYATQIGDYRFDATLSDTSLAASRATIERQRKLLEQARSIERAKLDPQNQLSYDIFVYEKEQLLRGAAFYQYNPQPLTGLHGIHLAFVQMLAHMPMATEADYRNYIARLEALPAHIAGITEQMREGMRSGWTAPRSTLRSVPDTLKLLHESGVDGALGQPFRQIPASIDPAQREALDAAGTAALQERVIPALQQLEAFVRNDYLPAARASIAASALPGGHDYYAWLVTQHTSTSMAPQEIHELGLQEVARIRALMPAVIARTGFNGTFQSFAAFARSDARLFYATPEAVLTRYRRILGRAAGQLPKLFLTIPQQDLLVKPATIVAGSEQGAAWYEGASGERPAAFVVNTARLDAHPLWSMETLALHEGVPGHHLQVSRARDIAGLPAFRRHAWRVAYGEGWATYAESLGPELGLFKDPFSLFGHLNSELFRAVRMVVDTGIHAQGWTRRQAIDYMNSNTANNPLDNEIEVDRYIAWPAQALAYKIGQLKIRALRDKAQAALGERFDVRRFHAVVLDQGALPLAILEQQVDQWLDAALRNAVAAPPVAIGN